MLIWAETETEVDDVPGHGHGHSFVSSVCGFYLLRAHVKKSS